MYIYIYTDHGGQAAVCGPFRQGFCLDKVSVSWGAHSDPNRHLHQVAYGADLKRQPAQSEYYSPRRSVCWSCKSVGVALGC